MEKLDVFSEATLFSGKLFVAILESDMCVNLSDYRKTVCYSFNKDSYIEALEEDALEVYRRMTARKLKHTRVTVVTTAVGLHDEVFAKTFNLMNINKELIINELKEGWINLVRKAN